MTGSALALVVAAAVLHTVWNALAKRARSPAVFLWLSLAVASLALSPSIAVSAYRSGLHLAALPFVAATVGIHCVYYFTLSRAYATGDFSQVYPISRGLGVTLVPVVAWQLFDERLSLAGGLGVGGVAIGIVLVGWRRGAVGRAVGWALLTGLCITAYSLVDRAGVERMHPLVYVTALGLGVTLMRAPWFLQKWQAVGAEWRAGRGAVLAAAACHLSAYLLVLLAFRLAKTGYVVAARELSIVLSTLVGGLWLKEGWAGARLAGAALIFAGVFCIALAR